MIPIQLWRARIGLFNAKRHSGPRSSFSSSSLALLHEKSSIPPTAHSPICDSPPGSSTDKHVPSTDHDHEHKRAFSTETDSSSSTVVSITHEQSAVYTNSKFSAQLGSKTVHSLLSSMTDQLYLPSDLLKDALVMLLIVIISQLLVLSGDVETNPGPIASDKPTMNQLISLKKTDGSGEYLRVIKWISSLSRSECVDFAYLLLVDPVKIETHQKKSSTDEFVRAVMHDWLSSGDDRRVVPRTWEALADCMEAAGLPGTLVKAIRETCPSGSPQVQIENEDVNMPPAKKLMVSSHSDTIEGSTMEHAPVQVLVKPDIPKDLALRNEYADMLVILQTARLSKERLSRLKLFLADYCDESSLEDCSSPKELVKQLKDKLKIDIFNIDTLTACCEYFRDVKVSQSVQKYEEHLNTFLSTTSVKEFQSFLQTEVTSHDDALDQLVYVPTEQLSPEYLASRGASEHVIGLRIAPNEDYMQDQNVAKNLMKIEAIMKITNIGTQGNPGIGKTSVLDLAMGKPPAGTRTSTDFADPPSRYMMLNSTDSEGVIQWKNVTNDEMAKMVYGAMKTKNLSADNAKPIASQPSKPTSSPNATSSTSAFGSPDPSSPGSSFSDYDWFPELLHDLHNSKKSDVIFNSHWVFISDCGGQPPFLDAAALFRQNGCLQIFPLKLNEPLNTTLECTYYANGEPASFNDDPSLKLNLTQQQTIEALAKSVALIQPPCLLSAKKSDCPKRTKFTIVGTFADEYEKLRKDDCTVETIENKESILKDVLKPYSQFLVQGSKIILQVNATTSDLEERKQLAEQLQRLIFDASDITITVTVKLLWFVFYHRLLTIAEEQHRPVFTLDECYRLGKFLGMDSNSETEEALQQFHDIGLIMHFDNDEKLRSSVVIKIKSVFKNVSRLISVSFLDRDFLSKHFMIFPPTGDKERFQSRGYFNRELLEKCICIESTQEPEIDVQLLLDILEHVKAIIAIKDTQYFMPCALPYAQKKKLCTFPPWVIRLRVEQGLETSYIPIPHCYLPTLVIFLLKQQNSPFTIDDDVDRQYRNFINLQYKRGGTVSFVENCCQIEVSYSWCEYKQFSSNCSYIRTLILDAIPLSEERLNIKSGTITKIDSFLCSCDGSDDCHLCTLDLLSGIAKCEKTKQPSHLEPLHLCWLPSDCVYQDKHVDEQETVTPNNLSGRIGVHKFNCEAPKLTANEAMHQLDLVDFPSHLWRKLANGLRLGGEARNFEEGIDNNDKLQRLITHWCDHEEHSWKQLVDAVVKCGQKIKARQLAGNVDATPPK